MKKNHLSCHWKGIGSLLVVLLGVFALSFSTCSVKKISMDTWHSPLYDSTTHQSTIHAAVESADGVKGITIKIIEGKMVDRLKLSDPPSVIPLRKDPVTFTKIFSYPAKPTKVEATYSNDFGDQALVSYQVKAVSWGDETIISEEITFAAGNPQATGYAFSPTNIRPVFWHRTADMNAKIDVCFFPDKDYNGLYESFTADMNQIINYAYFDTDPANTVVTAYGRNLRFYWNLWAGPFGADKKKGCPVCDKNIDPIIAIVDGGAIIRNDKKFPSHGSCTLGGYGTVLSPSAFSSPPDVQSATIVFMHESGHFLHGLGDEGHWSNGLCVAQYPNVFNSESDCTAAAKKYGFDVNKVDQIGATNIWHLNQADEIMGDTTGYGYGNYKFYHFCDMSVTYRYIKCSSGNCY